MRPRIHRFAPVLLLLMFASCAPSSPSSDAVVLDATADQSAQEVSVADSSLDTATVDTAMVDTAMVDDAMPEAAPLDVSALDVIMNDASTSVRHNYRPIDTVFPNPERGFYRYVSLPGDRDFSTHARNGYRLLFSYLHLDAYRTRRIDDAFLAQVTTALGAIRTAGLSTVLRFSYNDGPYPNPEPDASRDFIRMHLEQFAPILRANADIIFVVQAGFIGAWGEWHSSTNGLENPTDRRAVVEGVLNALPPDRMTQLRTPMYKTELYGNAALTASTGFSGTTAARIGHHNDCLLSSATDQGTYPSDRQAELERYVAQEGLFVPIGGETCAVFPARTDCAFAVNELERLHYTFINEDYHPMVLSRWRSMGCYETLQRRLGYRFALTTADFPDELRAGQSFVFRAELRNNGFAPMYNARPVFLRFEQGTRVELVRLTTADPRRWIPGTITVNETVSAPANLNEGMVQLSLWIPHGTEALRSRAVYSVRLANENVWDDTRGTNNLGVLRIVR